MTCPGCKYAETTGERHAYYAGCQSCEARSLIRHPEFQESLEAGKKTVAYQKLLARIFGSGADRGHEMAKEWLAKLSPFIDAAPLPVKEQHNGGER